MPKGKAWCIVLVRTDDRRRGSNGRTSVGNMPGAFEQDRAGHSRFELKGDHVQIAGRIQHPFRIRGQLFAAEAIGLGSRGEGGVGLLHGVGGAVDQIGGFHETVRGPIQPFCVPARVARTEASGALDGETGGIDQKSRASDVLVHAAQRLVPGQSGPHRAQAKTHLPRKDRVRSQVLPVVCVAQSRPFLLSF